MAMCETCGKTIPAAGRLRCEACRKVEEAKAIAAGEFQRCGNCATRPCGLHRDDNHGGCTEWTWLDLFAEVRRLREVERKLVEQIEEPEVAFEKQDKLEVGQRRAWIETETRLARPFTIEKITVSTASYVHDDTPSVLAFDRPGYVLEHSTLLPPLPEDPTNEAGYEAAMGDHNLVPSLEVEIRQLKDAYAASSKAEREMTQTFGKLFEETDNLLPTHLGCGLLVENRKGQCPDCGHRILCGAIAQIKARLAGVKFKAIAHPECPSCAEYLARIQKGAKLLGLPDIGPRGTYGFSILTNGIRTLQEQVLEIEGKICDECDGDGWVEERPGRRPCICAEETGPYRELQIRELDALRLLKSLLDATLTSIMCHDPVKQRTATCRRTCQTSRRCAIWCEAQARVAEAKNGGGS